MQRNPFEDCNAYAARTNAPEMLTRLARFWKLCELGAFFIRDIHEQLIPLRANLGQAHLHAALMGQAASNQPLRVSVLKTRKIGVSTWIQVLFDYLCAYYPRQRAITLAHRSESTDEIFEIARRAAVTHSARPADVLYRAIRWDDLDSTYHCMTAGGTAVGAGGTPNLVHLSEVPKWEQNKQETFYNVLNALPHVDTTIAVLESTAKGRELFFNHWDRAIKSESEYVALFLPWYLDDRCVAVVPDGFVVDADEAILIAQADREGIALSHAMLQWRRLKIAEIGADIFRQEFPATPEEAIQSAQGLVIPGLRNCLFDDVPFDPAQCPPELRVGGIDFGYADPTVIWGGYCIGGDLWLTDYYRRVEGLASDHVCAIAAHTTYYCDPANLSQRKELAAAAAKSRISGVTFARAPRYKRAGEDVVANELRILIRMVQTGRLHIAREIADQVIVEADSYVWNEKTARPNDARSDDCGHFDSIDALRYVCMGVDRGRQTSPTDDLQQIRSRSRRSQFSQI